jgi:hypothetical protein
MSNGYGSGGSSLGGDDFIDPNQSGFDAPTDASDDFEKQQEKLQKELGLDASGNPVEPTGDDISKDLSLPPALSSGDTFKAKEGDKERGWFEREVVHKTFPTPEILRLDYKNDEMSIKVQVTGNFLDDEWFWADFLKYFKLEVYIVSNLASENASFYNYSLFSRIYNSRIHFGNKYSSIPSLDNESDLLENKYIFDGKIEIPILYRNKYFIKEGDEVGIVARTFFDVEDFEKSYFDSREIFDFEPLTSENNGKWDMIILKTSKINFNPLHTPKKIRAKIISFSPNILWKGSFVRTITGGSPYGGLGGSGAIYFNSKIKNAPWDGKYNKLISDIKFSIEDFKETNMYSSKLEKQIDNWFNIEASIIP